MDLVDSELRWYETALNPIIRYFSSRNICMQRIAICETAENISIVCDSKIVIILDNQLFECIYCTDDVKKHADELCTMIHNVCKKLNRFNYKIRQIVVHSPSQRWSSGLIKGEVVSSVDKVGEKVVMLTCR